MKKATFQTDDCLRTCYLGPIEDDRRKVFELAAPHIVGDVFEIGAGESPWYWALGYINQVDSVIFSEYSQKLLDNYAAFVSSLDTRELASEVDTTLAFLKSKKILPEDTYLEDIFESILRKSTTMRFDFLNPQPLEKTFDTVLGFEAVEVVDTQDQLDQVMSTVYELLGDNGRFI